MEFIFSIFDLFYNFQIYDLFNRKNVSDILSESLQNGCQVTFHPDEQTASRGRKKQDFKSLTSVTRRCRQHVLSRCDRKWLDRQTNRKCRDGPTSYVFAGRRTFRNRFCAVCNHVNETYLQCTSTTPVDDTEIDVYSYDANRSKPFIIINMNDKQAMIHLTNEVNAIKNVLLCFLESCSHKKQ